MEGLSKQEIRSINAKLLTVYCILPTIADFLEEIPYESELQEELNRFIEKVRNMDDRVFAIEDEKKRIDLMDQQVYIQRSFRDWIIQQFGLAQKDIKKIPAR
jgi:hypothetical protein